MELTDIVKIATRPQKLLVGLMLNNTPKTPLQFRERCVEILDMQSPKELDDTYPGFSWGSINASLKRSLAPIAEGDAEAGYRLRGDNKIKKTFKEAILYEAHAGISLAQILGSEKGAPHVVNILQTLDDAETVNLTALANASHVNRVSLRAHLRRLRCVGFVAEDSHKLTVAGKGFVYFLDKLEHSDDYQPQKLALDNILMSLDLYAAQFGGNKDMATRMATIRELLGTNPGLSLAEIEERLGSTPWKPLKALRRDGEVVISGGRGIIDSPYLFSLANYD
jgi:hypothetical protein